MDFVILFFMRSMLFSFFTVSVTLYLFYFNCYFLVVLLILFECLRITSLLICDQLRWESIYNCYIHICLCDLIRKFISLFILPFGFIQVNFLYSFLLKNVYIMNRFRIYAEFIIVIPFCFFYRFRSFRLSFHFLPLFPLWH